MKTFLKQASQEEREALAAAVNSSVGYLRQIAGGYNNKKPSAGLCRQLVAAEPKLTLSGLRPDIWPPDLEADGPATSHAHHCAHAPQEEDLREAKGPVGRSPPDTSKLIT